MRLSANLLPNSVLAGTVAHAAVRFCAPGFGETERLLKAAARPILLVAMARVHVFQCEDSSFRAASLNSLHFLLQLGDLDVVPHLLQLSLVL